MIAVAVLRESDRENAIQCCRDACTAPWIDPNRGELPCELRHAPSCWCTLDQFHVSWYQSSYFHCALHSDHRRSDGNWRQYENDRTHTIYDQTSYTTKPVLHTDVLLFQGLNLFEQSRYIHHTTVSNDALGLGLNDTNWNQMEGHSLSLNNNGVARIGASSRSAANLVPAC